MNVIICFFLCYIALCSAIVFFRKAMPFVLIVGYITAAVLIFDSHQIVFGMGLILLLSFLVFLMRVSDGEPTKGKHDRKHSSYAFFSKDQGSSSIKWLFYIIPLFWPFLIVKLFTSGKTLETDMRPYDYEQFKKCNGK